MPNGTSSDTHRGERRDGVPVTERAVGSRVHQTRRAHAQNRYSVRCSCGYPLYLQHIGVTSRRTCTQCRRAWRIFPRNVHIGLDGLSGRHIADMECTGTRTVSGRVRRNVLPDGSRLPREGRTFGVEIEFVGISRQDAATAIRRAGVRCNVESYNHQRRDHWKIVTDASVSGGGEVVSPVLNGRNGLAQLKAVCDALTEAGARVNRSTGVHVHIGLDGLSGRQIADIARMYQRFEAAIDSIQPRSRRRSNNTYCRGLAGLDLSGATTVGEVSRALNYSRYYKVNVQCYARQRTIEFRQHGGSTDAAKLVSWVKLLMAMVETAASRGWDAGSGEGLAALLDLVGAYGTGSQPLAGSADELTSFFTARAAQFAASRAA